MAAVLTMFMYSHHYLLKSDLTLVHCLLCCTLTFLAYRFLKKRKCSDTSSSVMPGPKFPIYNIYGIFGYLPSRFTMNRMDLPPTAYIVNIFSGLASMFRNEKIIGVSGGFQKFVFLTKAESIEEFLSSSALVSKPLTEMLSQGIGNGLFTSVGPKWKARKKLLNPIFHYNILKEFVPAFDRQSMVLVDVLKRSHHDKWIDIEVNASLCTVDIICETILGINVEVQKNKDSKLLNAMTRATSAVIERAVNPILQYEKIFRLTAIGQQHKEDVRYIQKFVEQVMQETKEAKKLQEEGNSVHAVHRNSKEADMISIMLDLFANNPDISDADVRDELRTFLFAGADTTASGLTWALYLIGLYPQIQSKLHEELDSIFGDNHDRPVTADDLKEMYYLECVLKETQRIYPAVPFNPKYALEDFDLCGYKISKGTIIFIDIYDLHRNPEVFPNPEIFDPDRFLPENCAARRHFSYMPFSVGKRTCIGQRFAIMVMKTVVANVLRNFTLKALEHRDKICESFEIILRSPQPLKMTFTPRTTYQNLHKDTDIKHGD